MPIDTSRLIRTCDPYVYAEVLRKGYARYVDVKSGRRWEVRGVCTKIGKCWEGSDLVAKADIEAKGLDCPVGPGFANNCCPLEVVELTPDPAF